MKNLLLMVILCICSVAVNARTFYVSPTGNDANAGTITAPFKTVEKLSTVMAAGDIAYLRGGTYLSAKGNGAGIHFLFEDMNGTAANPITIQSYPGEIPIFNLSNITPTTDNPFGMALSNCNYVKLKGHMILKNLRQIAGGVGFSRGFDLSNSDNCTIEFLDIFNMGGHGFILENGSDNNFIINVDSHHNGDGLSDGGADAWDNADGFGCTSNNTLPSNTSTNNTFDGCRAWMNADDGWDFFGVNGVAILKNCLSFWNGVKPWGPNSNTMNEATMTMVPYTTWHNDPSYNGGSGEGFKLGPAEFQQVNVISKIVNNCVSFENRGTGYAANADGALTTRLQFNNNIAYKNDNDGFSFGVGWATGFAHIFKNNWSWSNNQVIGGADWVYDGLNVNGNISNNYWGSTYGGVNYGNLSSSITLNTADFLTVSSVGLDGARQANGTLPSLNYLKLAGSSDLINRGVNVGLTFISTAPDLGAYEYGISSPVPVTLVDFAASERTGKTLLQWATVTEINSSHFEVQRSIDGQNFEAIGSVNAANNSNARIDYQLTDNYPNLGVNYYRLKIVDLDGYYEYSRIVSINFRNDANTGSFEIKTAIISQQVLQINVSSSKQQPATLVMYDVSGRLIFTSNEILQKGVNNIQKPVTPAAGIYYLKLKTSDAMKTLPLLN